MSHQEDHQLETYKSMISIALEAMKSVVLLNGGAVVALLAFLGQVASRGQHVPNAARPIGFFIFGLTVGCLTFFTSYFVQFSLLNESYGRESKPFRHMPWLWVTFCLGVSGIVSFAIGAYSSLGVFYQIK